MRRRALLTTLGAATFSGCAALASPADDPTETDANTATGPATDATPTDDPAKTETGPEAPDAPDPDWTTVVDFETVPRTYVLPRGYRTDDGARVRMGFTSTATEDHPATVAVTLENANAFANTFRLDWLVPFGRLVSETPHAPAERWSGGEYTYRVGLVFAPTANHDLVDDAPAVELASDGQWRLAGELDRWLPETYELDAGETLAGEYALVGRPEGAGKGRPTGVYDFSTRDETYPVVVWNTDAPGPERESRFAGTDVPPLPGDAAVAWYHETEAATPTYVLPSAERAALPADVEFTFVNHSRGEVGCGHWNLYKLHDGEWFHVGPWVHNASCRLLRPGGADRWTLHAYPGEALDSADAAVFDHLGGGRYAAVAGYGRETPRSAALVELVGDPVGVEPTADVETEWSDRTVTVTASKWDDGEHPPSATLTVTRVDDAPNAKPVVPEQVMRRRYRGLRNTLAFVGAGAERQPEKVVLRTDEHVAENVVGYERDSRRFRFEGEAYEATISRREK